MGKTTLEKTKPAKVGCLCGCLLGCWGVCLFVCFGFLLGGVAVRRFSMQEGQLIKVRFQWLSDKFKCPISDNITTL